jgi:hypothetical protein
METRAANGAPVVFHGLPTKDEVLSEGMWRKAARRDVDQPVPVLVRITLRNGAVLTTTWDVREWESSTDVEDDLQVRYAQSFSAEDDDVILIEYAFALEDLPEVATV